MYVYYFQMTSSEGKEGSSGIGKSISVKDVNQHAFVKELGAFLKK